MPDSIEFFSSGSGRPLIMIHPLGLDHRTWDYCLDELSKYRTVMTYDLPGHGSSPHPDQNYSIEDLSKYLPFQETLTNFSWLMTIFFTYFMELRMIM